VIERIADLGYESSLIARSLRFHWRGHLGVLFDSVQLLLPLLLRGPLERRLQRTFHSHENAFDEQQSVPVRKSINEKKSTPPSPSLVPVIQRKQDFELVVGA
jgi:hypothetical protein